MIEKLGTDQLNTHRKLGAESVDILAAFEKINEIIDVVNNMPGMGCPPHNLSDYQYKEAWAGSVPPPNKICTKCLMTLRV